MKKYLKLIENLNGYKLVHWSKMKVGDRYITEIKARKIRTFRGQRKVWWDNFYIIKV